MTQTYNCYVIFYMRKRDIMENLYDSYTSKFKHVPFTTCLIHEISIINLNIGVVDAFINIVWLESFLVQVSNFIEKTQHN